jgi:O-antigen/teichoic acid export membrane protein
VLSRQLDVLLIGIFAGEEKAGLYRLAVQVSSIPARLVDPLYNVLLPKFSSLVSIGQKTPLASLVKSVSFAAISVSSIIYIAVILFGEPVLGALFGDEYRGTYPIVIIYMLAIGIASGCVAIVPFMHAHGDVKVCLDVQFKTTLLYIFMLLPLAYIYDVYGVAFAYIGYYFLWLYFIWPHFSRRL